MTQTVHAVAAETNRSRERVARLPDCHTHPGPARPLSMIPPAGVSLYVADEAELGDKLF
jgi:hypothetical protein